MTGKKSAPTCSLHVVSTSRPSYQHVSRQCECAVCKEVEEQSDQPEVCPFPEHRHVSILIVLAKDAHRAQSHQQKNHQKHDQPEAESESNLSHVQPKKSSIQFTNTDYSSYIVQENYKNHNIKER